jgi:hypothetical protein
MKIEQRQCTEALGWTLPFTGNIAESFQLVLAFGATAGEICGTVVSDDSLVDTAVHIDTTQVRSVQFALAQNSDSFQAGQWIAPMPCARRWGLARC